MSSEDWQSQPVADYLRAFFQRAFLVALDVAESRARVERAQAASRGMLRVGPSADVHGEAAREAFGALREEIKSLVWSGKIPGTVAAGEFVCQVWVPETLAGQFRKFWPPDLMPQ